MQRICLSLVLGLLLVGAAEGARPTKYQVTVNVSAGGSVTSPAGGISCPSSCTASVNAGTAITFTASPESGASFVGWGDACAASGTAVTCSLTVNAHTTVSATFEGGGGGGGPTVEELQARIEALEASLAGLEILLNGFTRGIDTNTGADTVRLTGANLQIVSGSGATGGADNGTGNLIIGYNEKDSADFYSGLPDERGGSHNLVIGSYHSYSHHSGFVAGQDNSLAGDYAVVLGGERNVAQGPFSYVVGGEYNLASGTWAGVTGGSENSASGEASTILGGQANSASGTHSAVGGGFSNDANGNSAIVTGGRYNTSAGAYSVAVGGENNQNPGERGVVVGGSYHKAVGTGSTVLGGTQNTATGNGSTVSGGVFQEAQGIYSSILGGLRNSASDYDSVAGGDDVVCTDGNASGGKTCGEGSITAVD